MRPRERHQRGGRPSEHRYAGPLSRSATLSKCPRGFPSGPVCDGGWVNRANAARRSPLHLSCARGRSTHSAEPRHRRPAVGPILRLHDVHGLEFLEEVGTGVRIESQDATDDFDMTYPCTGKPAQRNASCTRRRFAGDASRSHHLKAMSQK